MGPTPYKAKSNDKIGGKSTNNDSRLDYRVLSLLESYPYLHSDGLNFAEFWKRNSSSEPGYLSSLYPQWFLIDRPKSDTFICYPDLKFLLLFARDETLIKILLYGSELRSVHVCKILCFVLRHLLSYFPFQWIPKLRNTVKIGLNFRHWSLLMGKPVHSKLRLLISFKNIPENIPKFDTFSYSWP